jgi:hypothetical protein
VASLFRGPDPPGNSSIPVRPSRHLPIIRDVCELSSLSDVSCSPRSSPFSRRAG